VSGDRYFHFLVHLMPSLDTIIKPWT